MFRLKPITRNNLFNLTLLALIVTGLVLITYVILASFSYADKSGEVPPYSSAENTDLQRFQSDAELIDAFENLSSNLAQGEVTGRLTTSSTWVGLPCAYTAIVSGPEYSKTNIQVAGVDEADMIKTDGDYIYLVSKNKLVIVKAYPAGEARKVYETTYTNFTPQELFVNGDRLLVLGSAWANLDLPLRGASPQASCCYLPSTGIVSAYLYDISERADPELIKTVDIEGSYDTSRMIGDYAYFMVNTHKYIYLYGGEELDAEHILPACREDAGSFQPVARASGIYYVPPVTASSFITIGSINMNTGDVEKMTIVGSGGQVYVSQDNLYLTRSDQCYVENETTTIVKLHLNRGKITEVGSGRVPGHSLNQFSMDEYNGYFRIATTKGQVWNSSHQSTSNVYILDENMNTVGSLEGLAPGESIYSTRFMGSRLYMVTFKKVDPLFVIDLSEPASPKVLGKLKIPGYSDYLHPYDETHLIGIGKDTIDASEGEKSGRNLDFAWYQGVKMAIFDVSDVEHPKEMYKVVIGDRGTDSPVLYDHRAFLFDREKGLLVLPINVAEIQGEKTRDYQYGSVVFTGAYVYDVNLSDGFTLLGKISHYDSGDQILTGGYYYNGYYGDRSILRSLYIRDVLYTMSPGRLQLNYLSTLDTLKAIDLSDPVYITTYGPTYNSTSGFYAFPTANVT